MIYISGKITGLDLSEALAKFKAAEYIIREQGGDPVNPMEIVEAEEGKEWEDYMREDIIILMNCTEIYMLDNWTDSRGAKIEHALAKTLKYKIHYQ